MLESSLFLASSWLTAFKHCGLPDIVRSGSVPRAGRGYWSSVWSRTYLSEEPTGTVKKIDDRVQNLSIVLDLDLARGSCLDMIGILAFVPQKSLQAFLRQTRTEMLTVWVEAGFLNILDKHA